MTDRYNPPKLSQLAETALYKIALTLIRRDLADNRGIDLSFREYLNAAVPVCYTDNIMNRILRLSLFNPGSRFAGQRALENLLSPKTKIIRINNYTSDFILDMLPILLDRCRDVEVLDFHGSSMWCSNYTDHNSMRGMITDLVEKLPKLLYLFLGTRNRVVDSDIAALILNSCPILRFIDYNYTGNAIEISGKDVLSLTVLTDRETKPETLNNIIRVCPNLVRVVFNDPIFKSVLPFNDLPNLLEIRLNNYYNKYYCWKRDGIWTESRRPYIIYPSFSHIFQ